MRLSFENLRQSQNTIMLFMALVIGLLTAGAVYIFRHSIEWFHYTEFSLIRRIYSQVDKHDTGNLSAIKAALYKEYNNDDVDDYIESIVAGLNLD